MTLKRYTACLLLAILVSSQLCFADDWRDRLPSQERVAQHLQDISVTIRTSRAEGSGVFFTRDVEGAKVNFIWTAAHVVDDLRYVDSVISQDGSDRKLVKFRDCQIIKQLIQDGRRVGDMRLDAKVIRYSVEQDLALLRLRKSGFVDASVVFYDDHEIPALGTRLLHVGSLLGQQGSNSMTAGIQSQIGRIIDQQEFDQQTVTAFPGSSGGGVYLENGAYIGMLVRGAGEGFNLCIPVRRIKKWAYESGIAWAFDPTATIPSQAELDAMRIEDPGARFLSDAASEYPTLIRIVDMSH